MRGWIILLLAGGLLCAGIKFFQYMKFDAVVSITISKGPLQGLHCKLLNYKISYQDLQVKNKFWESQLGQTIFKQLSLAIQALILTSKKYVDVDFEFNYYGLWRRHYRLREHEGVIDLVLV